jgi:hypothetical protein
VAGFVLCVAGVVATVVMQGRALDKEVAHAQGRARAVANEVDGALGTTELDEPIDPDLDRQLSTRLNHALAGENFIAARVWTPDGTLRHSTLARDRSQADITVLRTATKGTGRITSVVDGEVMTTFVPLRDGANGAPFGAVEVQQPYTPVLAAAASPWSTLRLGALVAAGVMLFLFALGMLGIIPVRRNERRGAGFVGGARAADESDLDEDEPVGAELGPFKQPLPPLERTAEPSAASDPSDSLDPVAPSPVAPSSEASELERLRDELKALNRRTGARITELQDELDRSKEQLQEARKAAAPPVEDPTLIERMRDLQDQLRVEHMRAGTAEARVKGLEAQLKLLESRIAELTGPEGELETEGTRAAG